MCFPCEVTAGCGCDDIGAPCDPATGRIFPGAPSVCLPENVIPSAGASSATFQSLLVYRLVRVPESFRGGCSFGVGTKPISPAAIVAAFYAASGGTQFAYEAHMLLNCRALRQAFEGPSTLAPYPRDNRCT